MDRALLAQLIAQRFGANRGGDTVEQDFTTLLGSQISDPVLAALASTMLRQHSEADEDPEPSVDHERLLSRAKRIIQRQQQELASADKMAQYIAGIFGACPHCWGLNAFCPHCHGEGHPGSTQPHEDELRRWIEPALARLGLRIMPMAKLQQPARAVHGQVEEAGTHHQTYGGVADRARQAEQQFHASPFRDGNVEPDVAVEDYGG